MGALSVRNGRPFYIYSVAVDIMVAVYVHIHRRLGIRMSTAD